jgi:hypothetical protein
MDMIMVMNAAAEDRAHAAAGTELLWERKGRLYLLWDNTFFGNFHEIDTELRDIQNG